MTRLQFFTENVDLLMHLSHIGSVAVGAKDGDETVAFPDQEVDVVILSSCRSVGDEATQLIENSPIMIQKIDFDTREVVLVLQQKVTFPTRFR